MALVLAGYTARIKIVDTGNNSSIKEYDLTAATFADALSDTQAIVLLLQAVTAGTIAQYTVGPLFREDAFTFPANAQIENIAEVQLRLVDPFKSVNIQIPAPVTTLFQAVTGDGANIVDITNEALIDYVAIWQAGQYATISDGENVAAAAPIRAGKRIHRKSRKG